MSAINDHNRLRDLRRNLYDRGNLVPKSDNPSLSRESIEVARNWDIKPPAQPEPTTSAAPETQPNPTPVAPTPSEITPTTFTPTEVYSKKPHRRYRLYILAVSLLIFIFGVGLSSFYLYFGGNQISSDLISIEVQAPKAVGGGDTFNASVSLTNDNSVPIESATLIVTYPSGTRSSDDGSQVLLEERIAVPDIAPGAVYNVPLAAVVFGEENQTKQLAITFEYRIAGSNSIFYKEIDPLEFIISSSPVFVRLEGVDKISSGQTMEVTMTVVSNSLTPLTDILVKAEYPTGFRFESSDPAPVFNKDTWRIDKLEPQESVTITFTGVIVGLQDEMLRLTVAAGPASSGNSFTFESQLTEAEFDFVIEQSFIAIGTSINGQSGEQVVLEAGEKSRVEVSLTNTLPDNLYDLSVEIVPSGSALSERSVSAGQGFYDSETGNLRWSVSSNPDFAQVRSGEKRRLVFMVNPNDTVTSASYDLLINVYARRVDEPNASEQIIGSKKVNIRFSSGLIAGSQAGHNSLLATSGPVPPVVGDTTIYTITMLAQASGNNLTDVVMKTSLPAYVDWLDQVEGAGELTFNPVSKQIEWQVEAVSAGAQIETSFQVSITPHATQIGRTLTLLNPQMLWATDNFSGGQLQIRAKAVSTELSTEAGYQENNGVVGRR